MTEDDLQKRAATYLDDLGLLWNHCPSESRRGPRQGRALKLKGMKRGVPDIVIYDPPPRLPGLIGAVIELKIPPNKPTPEQRSWLLDMARRRYFPAVHSDGELQSLKKLIRWLGYENMRRTCPNCHGANTTLARALFGWTMLCRNPACDSTGRMCETARKAAASWE